MSHGTRKIIKLNGGLLILLFLLQNRHLIFWVFADEVSGRQSCQTSTHQNYMSLLFLIELLKVCLMIRHGSQIILVNSVDAGHQ